MVSRDRRSFLGHAGSASLALPLLQSPSSSFTSSTALGQVQELPRPMNAEEMEIDKDTLRFWTEDVRKPHTEKFAPQQTSSKTEQEEMRPTAFGRSKEPSSMPSSHFLSTSNLNYEPMCFYYDKDAGFQKANLLSPDRLPKKSDMEIFIQMLECRPSVDAHARLSKLETGSLRIDFQQAGTLPNVAEPMAWSAIAGFLGGTKTQDSQTRSVNFDLGSTWGKTKKLSLPGGQGFWTWNFFLKEKESPWGKFLSFVHQISPLAGPYLLGLPAIGQTALKQVDGILGRIIAMKSSRWVFQSRDVELYGTRDTRDRVGPRAIQLRTGDYILLPTGQSDKFQEAMKKMMLADGRLIPKDTSLNRVIAASEDTLPDLTYMTLHITARHLNYCRLAGA